MFIGLLLGFCLGFAFATILFMNYFESLLNEKKKLWRLEEDEAREGRGESVISGL